MKTVLTTLALCCACAFAPAYADDTPAERAIKAAEARIATLTAAKSLRAEALNGLALALARRARETSDTDFYDRAHAVLDRAQQVEADNRDTQRTRIWVWLGEHEFRRVFDAALALHKANPDDLMTLAMLTDASVELGRYADAERYAQWLLDLRPGNVVGLTRAAYLRELFGDVEGAIELMEQAYNRTPSAETEDRAWLLTHLSHLQVNAGRLDQAEALVEGALREFPAYHYALAQLSEVRHAQGRHDDALVARRAHVKASPHPENGFRLGEALQRVGRAAEAKGAYSDFERAALAESEGVDNANRELVLYWLDHSGQPAKALLLAQREAQRRQDVYTLDTLAWAQYRNGLFADAHTTMARVLAVGTRDPGLLYHAGLIARKAGDAVAAREHLQQALARAPWHDLAASAREALTTLPTSAQAAVAGAAHP
ncbi:MAG: tetratricopeptide repeat protein [Methyloversatilis sp.]|uniref:tetratricopeptide repeat protein n=1 Tax=Methyloversatilis sp. TaxID=2569862 RepID=UPI00273738E9|nr:tetratricopeptide repeat protein [Methyloversatilis sp.]MDP3873098.1 tetratricopeptide repeat protein [Methyloversatilis sp.]